MARKKKKTHSWIDVKNKIQRFNKDQLTELIGDLYRLSENNKESWLSGNLRGLTLQLNQDITSDLFIYI